MSALSLQAQSGQAPPPPPYAAPPGGALPPPDNKTAGYSGLGALAAGVGAATLGRIAVHSMLHGAVPPGVRPGGSSLSSESKPRLNIHAAAWCDADVTQKVQRMVNNDQWVSFPFLPIHNTSIFPFKRHCQDLGLLTSSQQENRY